MTVLQGIEVAAVKHVCYYNHHSVHNVRSLKVTLSLSLAICNPECQNGGVCCQPNVCDCPAGYSGDHCETRMFLTIILYTM